MAINQGSEPMSSLPTTSIVAAPLNAPANPNITG